MFSSVGNMESNVKFRMFGWVPDGTYEHAAHFVRYVIADGNPGATAPLSRITCSVSPTPTPRPEPAESQGR